MQTNDSGSDKSTVECYSCGTEYINIGRHWSDGACDHPPISNRQHEIITGLLLGDGYINRDDANPRLIVETVCEPFMQWIDAELGILTTGVREQNRKTLSDSSVYRVLSRRHPGLNEYADWYSSGKKELPTDIELTQLTGNVWYCCDGHLESYGQNHGITLAAGKKISQRELVLQLLADKGIHPRFDGHGLRFNVAEAAKFLEWIGDPLPGFEHKWP